MSGAASLICLFACHGGPADHFISFKEALLKAGHRVEVYATGPALKKFRDNQVDAHSFSLEQREPATVALELAEKCKNASAILTDVGDPFDIELQKAFDQKNIKHFSYYDNPESNVPGEYQQISRKVMEFSQKVLFANENLVNGKALDALNVPKEKGVAIGFSPLQNVDKVIKRRNEERDTLRRDFLKKHQIIDNGQKVLVYFGGNNEVFEKAFRAFLGYLGEAQSDERWHQPVIVFQKHPGAKKQECHESLIVSDLNTEDAQVLADAVLYYQTSMAPQFALAGIPIIQVGHEPYEDVIVRNKLGSVATSTSEFIDAIATIAPKEIQKGIIYKEIGFSEEWKSRLLEAFR